MLNLWRHTIHFLAIDKAQNIGGWSLSSQWPYYDAPTNSGAYLQTIHSTGWLKITDFVPWHSHWSVVWQGELASIIFLYYSINSAPEEYTNWSYVLDALSPMFPFLVPHFLSYSLVLQMFSAVVHRWAAGEITLANLPYILPSFYRTLKGIIASTIFLSEAWVASHFHLFKAIL